MPADDSGLAAVAAGIGAARGARLQMQPAAPVAGGCINQGFRWMSDAGPLFVKVAPSGSLPMFEAEADGLRDLARAGALRVPAVLAVGTTPRHAYLALEWIGMTSPTAAAQRRMGELLARQHRCTTDRFGWHRDNTIGSTPQVNDWQRDWTRFFREQRLGYQLELAARNGHAHTLGARASRLLERLHLLLGSHAPQPALLHGDLWSGNAGMDEAGAPVVFDPAVYYGDREADIAMMRLFGGFGPAFFAAYDDAWPLPLDADARTGVYNLYHVLNHLNLFGGSYLEQSLRLIDSLLARTGG